MATLEEEKEEFLKHYGVKGMRWGKRKNPNYSETQIKKDTLIYGRRGASRINKALNKGDQISTARSIEKTRRDRVMGRNKYVRQVGKLVGGAAAAVAGFAGTKGLSSLANTTMGQTVVNKLFGSYSSIATQTLANPLVQATVATGAAKIGYMLSGDLAVAANMRAAGYDPSRR